jgi:hypothetical protein
MTALVPIVVAVCILAVAYLCGYVHGHLSGSKAGRQLAEREQERELALLRIKQATAEHEAFYGALNRIQSAATRQTAGQSGCSK